MTKRTILLKHRLKLKTPYILVFNLYKNVVYLLKYPPLISPYNFTEAYIIESPSAKPKNINIPVIKITKF